MSTYPKVLSFDKISYLFATLASLDKPTKVTYRYLASIGFPSSRDRDLLTLLKDLSLIDLTGKPSKDYLLLREKNLFSEYLRTKITQIYSEVLALDKNLPNVPTDTITGYFGAVTGESSVVVTSLANTFITLCQLCQYGPPQLKSAKIERSVPKINLSLKLPATTDERVYDSLFKHLRDLLNP